MSHAIAFTTGLADDEWSRRERVFRQFDRAWLNGARPAIDEYLPADPGDRRSVLVELVHTDLEYRLKVGEPARVEDYLARYPELGSDHEAELGLIEAELELRRRRDPAITLDEFLARFPGHRAELLSTRRGWPRPASPALVCPNCRAPIDAPAGASREKIECPACAATFRVAPSNPLPWASERPSRLGRYDLIEEVGRGQFGIVFRARDTELDRTVAVKVARAGWLASPGEADWFIREAQSAGGLAHPNIVPVFDYDREGETCYIVCEFVPGTTLAGRLAGGRLLPREAAELAASAADALHHAHLRGVVHRDVKPSNILLDRAGQPRLTDFGLAKRDAGEATLTIDGELLGTPAYTSPEQARGEARGVDGRCDVYSLGVVLYEMLTGERPFQGTGQALLLQVLEDEPRPPRRLNDRLPRDLETICLKCLSKAPRDRYASAEGLAADLRRYLAGEPVHARPVGPLGRAWRWCRRNPVIALLLATVLVAVAAGFAGVTWQWQRARQQWLRAERGWARADENYRTARKTIGDCLTTVSGNAALRRDLPGLNKFRGELLDKALSYYQGLVQKYGDDPSLRLEVANVDYMAGVVYQELGSLKEAEAADRRALTAYEALQRSGLDAFTLRQNLAWTYGNLGDVLCGTGRVPEAERSYVRSLDLTRGLATSNPGNAVVQESLATVHLKLATVSAATGHMREAEQAYSQASDVLRTVVAVQPDAVKLRAARLKLVNASIEMGAIQLRTGRVSEAERTYTQALASLQALIDAEPNAVDLLGSLVSIDHALGKLCEDQNRYADAEARYTQAIEALRKITSLDPSAATRLHLARMQMNLGEAQGLDAERYGTERRPEAEANLVQALEIFLELNNAEPQNSAYRFYLARTYMMLARVHLDTGRASEAEQGFVRARELLQELVRSQPRYPATMALLAGALNGHAEALSEEGRLSEASAILLHAVDIQREVLSKEPDDVYFRLWFGNQYGSLARLQWRLNHPSEADEWIRQLVELQSNNPDNIYNAACLISRCVPLIGKDAAGVTAEEEARRREYSERAIEMLRRSVRAGFKDGSHMARDQDLLPLHSRDDFRSLIMDLVFPANPFAR